jgi:hypothetical protein
MNSATNKLWSVLSIVVVLLLLYFLAVRIGVVCTLYGFNPDCCWLLRTGQIICDTGRLPEQDPFSYALAFARQQGDPQPYIIYQWLSEVIFFRAYLLFNLVQLAALAAVIYALSFVVIPLRSCLRFDVARPWLFGLVILEGLTSNLRNFIRPEVFTYLMTALLLSILQSLRLKYADGTHTHIGWRTIGACIVLLVLSCNIHITFIVHLLILFWYSLAFLAEDLVRKKDLSAVTKTALLGTFLSTVATLINPYGIRLWLSVPSILYSPLAPNVVEMQELSMSLVVTDVLYFPYIALLIMTYLSIILYPMIKPEEGRLNLRSPLRLSSFLLIVICSVFGFHRIRYTVIGSMFIVFELTNLLASKQVAIEKSKGEFFWNKKYSLVAVEIAIAIFACFGAYYAASKTNQLAIPTARRDFNPPFQGIKYLLKNYDGGRLFADHEVSDMCELYLQKCSIFQDTRYDGYDKIITSDYVRLLMAEAHWKEVLNGYKIEWVFAMKNQPIARALPSIPGWKIVYEDPVSVIFHKI